MIVVIIAIDEHDHVRILLDGAGLTQVGEHGPVIGPLLHGTGQLRECYHRHLQLSGDTLQRTGDFRDLLLTGFAAAAGPLHQLQVVDHHHVQSVFQFVLAAFAAQLRHTDAGSIIDDQLRLTDDAGALDQIGPVGVREVAVAQHLRIHPGFQRKQAVDQLLL